MKKRNFTSLTKKQVTVLQSLIKENLPLVQDSQKSAAENALCAAYVAMFKAWIEHYVTLDYKGEFVIATRFQPNFLQEMFAELPVLIGTIYGISSTSEIRHLVALYDDLDLGFYAKKAMASFEDQIAEYEVSGDYIEIRLGVNSKRQKYIKDEQQLSYDQHNRECQAARQAKRAAKKAAEDAKKAEEEASKPEAEQQKDAVAPQTKAESSANPK